jgi:succinate dehydrogenase / fumarate reductase cytochrome b subunit
MGGIHTYEAVVGWIDALPGIRWLEVIGLYLPLAFHLVSGLHLAARPVAHGRGDGELSPRRLKQLSGAVLLIFLAYHLWHFRLRVWSGELLRADYYPELCASLSSTVWGGIPLQAAGYLVGVGALAFHLARGIYDMAAGGAETSPARRAIAGRSCLLLGLGVFSFGAAIVVDVATGALLVATGESAPAGE